MNKKVKYLSYAIAVVLVTGIMTVAIWAATSATAGISANVSWTATEGIAFELEAWVVNNATANGIGATTVPKSISKQIVTASTSNTAANNLAGDLACGFYDGTPEDGVNNPSNIIFTYKIKNTGSNALKVTATKTPNNQAESGTTAENHKPAVALSSKLDSADNTSSCISSITGSGFNIPAGKTLEYIVTLSISNADLSITNYDAGVTFSFGVGTQPATATIYIDGIQQTGVASATTVGDYLDALDGSQYPGYFYDEDLTIYADEDEIVTNDTKLYTKPATLDQLEFVDNGDNTYSVKGKQNNGRPEPGMPEGAGACIATGDIIVPMEYNGKPITQIYSYAFYTMGGSLITNCILPNSIITIGSHSFRSCSNLTSVIIPDSVTSIGDDAFISCSGLTSITIGDSVTSIGGSAFWGCTSLTSITIGDSVTSIGVSAFNGCTSLASITIPDSVTSIGYYAFSDCSGLTSITIPDSVTSIGDYTFEDCSGLTSITIPDSVTSIGYGAFRRCESLTSIYIPSSVTTISASNHIDSPFYGCSSSLKIYCEASSKPSGWGFYWNYYNSPTALSTTWGVTREQYNSQYA